MYYDPWYVNTKDTMGREAYDRMHGMGRRASIKCFNCNNYGHYKSECSRPEPPLRCHLCAELGHELQSCQQKLCGSCFKKAHDGPVCSDIWRQFHNTTECRLLQPADKPYAGFVTNYDDRDSSQLCTDRESLKAIKRRATPSGPADIPSFKRSRHDDQHSKVDSFPTAECRWGDDRYSSQCHSNHPVSSGQAQGGYSQTFSDHQTFGFQYRDPPGPAVVGVPIPPQGPGVYGHGNRATIAHRTDATPEDRPMKRKGVRRVFRFVPRQLQIIPMLAVVTESKPGANSNAAISSVDRVIAVSAGPVPTFNFTPISFTSSGSSASTLDSPIGRATASSITCGQHISPIRFPRTSLPGNALWRAVKHESPPQCGTTTCLSMQTSKADTNPSNTHRKRINSAVSLGHSGLMSKAYFDILYVLRSFPKGSGAGPSCLSAQHLLDAASIPLPTPIASSLRSVVNLLVSGKVPLPVSVFLAGDTILDPLGHHAVSCRHGGFFGHTAQLPEGHFGRLLPQDSPAGEDRDLGWDRGHPAAFDVTVISPLTPATLNFSAVTEGAAAQAAEERKHASNDAKCEDLGWTCIPLAVESYGNWGKEARDVFNRLASLLAFGHSSTKPRLLTEIYSHLNMSLARFQHAAFLLLKGLHSAMDSNDPWHINEKDNVGGHQNVSTNLFRAVVKCSKCRLKGHIAAHCTNPKCILSLSVPSELCQCCHRWGHSETDTKDLFRLSIEQQRQTRRVFCCICAAEGHFGYECHLVHPMEKPYSPLVTQYGHQRSQAKRHTSANTSTASSIPSIQTHRNDISYKNTQSSDVSKDSWPVLHSLPKCAFTASCVSQREDICAPPFVQPEPWPVL
eukprot:Em0014g479a